jgi:hypothetical protein
MPTSVGVLSASFPTSHSAMPRRVQYLRSDAGGGTSTGAASPSAKYTRRPFRLEVGVSAPE